MQATFMQPSKVMICGYLPHNQQRNSNVKSTRAKNARKMFLRVFNKFVPVASLHASSGLAFPHLKLPFRGSKKHSKKVVIGTPIENALRQSYRIGTSTR